MTLPRHAEVADLVRQTGRSVNRTVVPLFERVAGVLEPYGPARGEVAFFVGCMYSMRLPETALDAITTKKYPTPQAFEKDIPRILRDLGFSAERANYVASHITVDSSRGAGHAMGAERRGDKAHLRTRVEPGGMDYKGYNIAVHELGHNVEQTFSLYDIDYTLLSGVPNTAFTEALAFLFQARDLDLLGRPEANAEADRMRVLDSFWNTREIAGSALVELDVWHWLYDHPGATATEIREATVKIAQDAPGWYSGCVGS
jgi:hypothetical protein